MRQIQISTSFTDRQNIAMEAYFKDIQKIRLISEKEETELAKKVRQGDRAAFEKLCLANLRFVISIAKKYQDQGLSLNDLISEGNIGLMKAAERFDESKGFKFISFAVWWIRQSILAALAEYGRTIRLPVHKIEEVMKIKKAYELLEKEKETAPTCDHLGEYLGYSAEKIRELQYIAPRTRSYDAENEGNKSLIDYLQDEEQAADHLVTNKEKHQDIRKGLQQLTNKDRQVLELSFGMHDDTERTSREIAGYFDLTAGAVQQIRLKALQKLKQILKP